MLPTPLVTPDWLAAHLADVTVVDVRWSIPTGPMRSDYLSAHIPGAVFADLDVDLSAPAGPRGRHPLPTPEAFAHARSRLGLTGPIVAYDDRGGPVAARLWWMLDSIGVPAAVLDGGLASYEGPLVSGSEARAQTSVAPIPWPSDRYIDAHDLLPAIANGDSALDARTPERFRGDPNPIDEVPGHVPGAICWPWQQNLHTNGRFLPPEALAAMFAAANVHTVVGSCGSGVTGCHNLLAARLAGLPAGRLYAGSWSEWSQDPSRPISKGERP